MKIYYMYYLGREDPYVCTARALDYHKERSLVWYSADECFRPLRNIVPFFDY